MSSYTLSLHPSVAQVAAQSTALSLHPSVAQVAAAQSAVFTPFRLAVSPIRKG